MHWSLVIFITSICVKNQTYDHSKAPKMAIYEVQRRSGVQFWARAPFPGSQGCQCQTVYVVFLEEISLFDFGDIDSLLP